jgi:uncharacterized membrane protein YfcA
MSYLVVCGSTVIVAALTLYSGFGLGTLLMPVLAIFFPVEAAVAATAVVHLGNNLFKATIFGKFARGAVVLRFALPAALFAVAGAGVLALVSDSPPLTWYQLGGQVFLITPVKLLVALIVLSFAVIELRPKLDRATFAPRYLLLGGALSGFFGGLSGHQGALRTAFLSRAGLGKEAFLGTMIVCAVIVDGARLLVYGLHFFGDSGALSPLRGQEGLIAAAMASAFLGSWIATRLVRRVTLDSVHRLIGVLLMLFAVALGAGLI